MELCGGPTLIFSDITPFALWHILASGAELLPGSPLTCNRVVLMQHDNVTSIDWPGLQSLDIAPTEIDTLVSGGSEEIRIEYLAHALCSSKNHAVTFTQ